MRHVSCVVLLLAWVQLSTSACVDQCNSTGSGWNSNITILERTQASVLISWTADTPNTTYNVRWAQPQQQGQSVEVGRQDTEALMFNISSGLVANTMYEVRVCRQTLADQMDDCGNCNLCFTTQTGPPPAPTKINLFVSGPETLTITFDLILNSNVEFYRSVCIMVDTGEIASNLTIKASSRSNDSIFVERLSPNTTYSCSVAATNSQGQGPFSTPIIATTSLRITDVALLLMVFGDRIDYSRLTESSVLDVATYSQRTNLLSTDGSITGLDYHFHQEDLYYTVGTSLYRLGLSVTKDSEDDLFSLAVGTSPVALLSDLPVDALGSVAVDWVYHEVYWIEYLNDSSSRIMRGLASEGLSQRYCVAHFSSRVRHIAVNPINGYFFWNDVTGLHRAPLNSVRVNNSTCPPQIPNTQTIISQEVSLFIFESDRIFVLLPQDPPCLIDGDEFAATISVTNLNGESPQIFAAFPAGAEVPWMSSYEQRPIFSLQSSTFSGFNVGNIESFLFCGGSSGNVSPITVVIPNIVPNIMRAFRESQQPLPVPPFPVSNVRILPTNTTATVSWEAPTFPEILFSSSAYNAWQYTVTYNFQGAFFPPITVETTDLTVTLTGLNPGQLYQVNIEARGLGAEVRQLEQELVFTTQSHANLRLVLATQTGLISSDVVGNSECLDAMSIGLAGVTHDSYIDTSYLVTDGTNGEVISYNSQTGQRSTLASPVNNPFAIRLDWVTQRLFWVEQSDLIGSNSIMSRFVGDGSSPEIFEPSSSAVTISTTAMDATNGFLFWISGTLIHRKSLSGVEFEPSTCTTDNVATALTVDPVNQRLYWISDAITTTITINQLDYTDDSCEQTIPGREISGFTFTSSATVLAYAADTLFITSQTSSRIYAIPSEYREIPNTMDIALNEIEPSTFCQTDTNFGITDIAFTTTASQPLPVGIDQLSRVLSEVTPQPIPSPPFLGPGSSASSIVIAWEPAPTLLNGERLTYILRYSLNSGPEQEVTVTESTSVTLDNQQDSTEVSATVTTCSVWSCGEPSGTGLFTSAPAVPGPVSNVNVFVYLPLANSDSDYSALVYWDAPPNSIVDNYTFAILENGVELDDIYQPPTNITFYSVLQRDVFGNVSFFLAPGQNYEIQISGVNPSGEGASVTETFSFNGPDYPRQVLAITPTAATVAGDLPGLITLPSLSDTFVMLTDTIAREAYYYDHSLRSILKSSLRRVTNNPPLLLIDQSLSLLDMSYDWIAKEIYYAVRQIATDTLQFYRVSVLRRNSNIKLFSKLVLPLAPDAVVRLTMDPATGLIVWSQTQDSVVQLNSVSLFRPNATSSNVLSTTTSRRKRQTVSLSSLDLTSVLALDSVTGALLLAATSGDIHSCNLVTLDCSVLVQAMNDISLPPTGIAVDDQHIYWTGGDGVFAVTRDDLTTPIPLSPDTPSSLAALSPGAQPLGSVNCLSPDFTDMLMRPVPILVSKTSNSADITWEVPTLPSMCDSVTFSYPPLLYLVSRNTLSCPFANFPVLRTFNNEAVVPDLASFSGFNINIAASNVFTKGRDAGDTLHGNDLGVRTLEGVPDMVFDIQATVFGTANVTLTWATGELRGDEKNVSYIILTQNGAVIEFQEMTTLSLASGIVRGQIQEIEIIVNNGVFNSTGTTDRVVFWLLAPAPIVADRSNNSLSVTIQLISPNHDEIRMMTVQYCQGGGAQVGGACECPSALSILDLQPGLAPMMFSFNLTGLEAFTDYCVQSVAEYRLGSAGPPAEVTPGQGVVIKTEAGVPDAPTEVMIISTSRLSWTRPLSRHENGIEGYEILAVPESEGHEQVLVSLPVPSEEDDFDLQTLEDLEIGVFYNIRLRALNQLGAGPFSSEEDVAFERTQELTLPVIIGAAVGATLFISIVLCFVLFCVWFVRLSRPKEQEIRSLSYMYGPDHELRNLRNNNQGTGQYSQWSRDDYVCTAEDLDQLSKFPRHNLKLENFIDRGEFGEVYQGTATDILGADTGPTPVAVKTLRKNANHEDQKKFLSEASLMSNFNHPNIVKVLGVCLDNDPVYIIMELMPAGDLLKFLRDAKRDHGPALLTLSEQVQVSLDVAHGCQYLEQQHFIHRDLAARNCLVSSKGADRVVKIGDFGLARDLYSSDYYQVEGQRRLPVRWMAPEALLQGKFAVESDIWSFGVLLWEIMSLGNQPYPGRINQEVLQFVTAGGRLDKPDKCPSKLYHLMQNCWKNYPSDRPHFDKIVTLLTGFLGKIKRPDSIYHSDSESEEEEEPPAMVRTGSSKTPSRTPSIKTGFMNLARSGSFALRNSFRRHGSIHKREDNTVSQPADDGNSFRERGPF